MCTLIILTISLLFGSISFAQSDSSKTEMTIIGTIHTGNKQFNHKTLYSVLASLKPDIVLSEYSEPFKTVFGLKTAAFLKIAKPSIEQLALQTISKKNKEVLIFPYDTSFASRNQYIKKLFRIESALFESLNNSKMSLMDSTLYADYANLRNHYGDVIMKSGLSKINQPEIVNMAREKYKMEELYILPIAKKYLSDTLVVEEFENELIFWNLRNNYMVKQIKTYSKMYPGKRIAVLCGLNHKYFLTDRLLGDSSINLTKVELNE